MHVAALRREAPRRPRRRPAAQHTKEVVLAAAVEEFAEHGLAGARVDRIARRAGVNKQALYYHHGNKEALFQAALEYGYSHFRIDALHRDLSWLTPEKAMRKLVSVIFEEVSVHRDLVAMISDENRYRGKHLVAATRRRIQAATAPTVEDVRRVLERGQREGVFARNISPSQVFLSIIALSMFYFTNSYTLSAILGTDLLRKSEVSQRREHVVDLVVRALRV